MVLKQRWLRALLTQAKDPSLGKKAMDPKVTNPARRPRLRVLDPGVAKSGALEPFSLFYCAGAGYSEAAQEQGFGLGQGQGSRVRARGRQLPLARLGTGRRAGEAAGPGSASSACSPHSAVHS